MADTLLSSATVPSSGWVAPSREGGRIVLWLGGEHDLSTRESLSATLARAIASVDADVVVDLSKVEFMDAGTVGVLLRTHALLRLRSRSLTLREPSRPARRVIDPFGIEDLMGGVLTKRA